MVVWFSSRYLALSLQALNLEGHSPSFARRPGHTKAYMRKSTNTDTHSLFTTVSKVKDFKKTSFPSWGGGGCRQSAQVQRL